MREKVLGASSNRSIWLSCQFNDAAILGWQGLRGLLGIIFRLMAIFYNSSDKYKQDSETLKLTLSVLYYIFIFVKHFSITV